MADKMKVLVVDDEADILNLAKIMLETGGYEVQTASRGQEALSKVSNNTPDLILLDIRMPELDGFEVCKRLKGNPETASIPVVLYSASGGEGTLARVREVGADAFILKPFTLEQLLDTTRKHIKKTNP